MVEIQIYTNIRYIVSGLMIFSQNRLYVQLEQKKRSRICALEKKLIKNLPIRKEKGFKIRTAIVLLYFRKYYLIP